MKGEELIRMRYEAAKKATGEFAADAAKDTFEALKWVNNAIEAAATVRVFGITLRNIDKGVSEEAMLALAKSNVLRLARSGHIRSTGALESPLHAEEMRAWTEVVSLLETGDTF